MAKIYKKKDLLFFVSQAINDCGWNIIYLNDEHPFKVKIFNQNNNFLVKIIIYNITHGGGYKRAANEYRIQFKEPSIEYETGFLTLILGYYDILQVFAGFDISKHLGTPGYSSSFQIKEETLEKASINGFSACDKGNNEIAVAFRPDFFVEYVSNLEVLHTFGESRTDLSIFQNVLENEIVPNDELLQQISTPRQKTLQTISKAQRDNSFRSRVLRAYNYKCAFSGIQLKLVDAAHIVPVNYEGSTDETSNGIALSPNYHKAYDKGLITFNESYQILFNDNEIQKLKNMNLTGGLKLFLKNTRPIIDVPPALSDRPNVAYIKTANRLRGW
ncbi:MAG TPA: HNH endonuclease [bacterium]|nr:HNH endonuclease [bacterium]HPN42751.1 HNH endonuclease [bacterium]